MKAVLMEVAARNQELNANQSIPVAYFSIFIFYVVNNFYLAGVVYKISLQTTSILVKLMECLEKWSCRFILFFLFSHGGKLSMPFYFL